MTIGTGKANLPLALLNSDYCRLLQVYFNTNLVLLACSFEVTKTFFIWKTPFTVALPLLHVGAYTYQFQCACALFGLIILYVCRACWLHCHGPIRYARILSSECWALTSRSGEGLLQTMNVWDGQHQPVAKPLWGLISLVQNHKRCASLLLLLLLLIDAHQ